jgi:hypothetical protein
MTTKELKTAKELETIVLDIVRRMQGCGHVEAVSVASHPHEGWVISGYTRGHANNSDVGRAIVVAQADLRELYVLAAEDDKTG